jgi:cellulose synthase (UDP-forming)
MTTFASSVAKSRREAILVLPETPDHIEKASYAWRSLPFLATALVVSSLCIVVAQLWFEIRNPIALPYVVYTGLFAIYQIVSLPSNFAGQNFDLAKHDYLVAEWAPWWFPTVDIFLPICGEPIEVFRNTWTGVFELVHAYEGEARAFVLDDGPGDLETKELADSFGFTYIRRPNPGYHKKSGNLAFALKVTSGDHVVIFDADFRPRSDFLAETLPYLEDPEIGLVQTPQFFRSTRDQTWVERAAGATLEVFYRTVQVSRNRFGSALCVGSNAVYRRTALRAAGGFTDIPYAEDSHTGLDMRFAGYQLVYLPVVLAAGICPATIDSYMRQQYRWCCGATSLIWTRHMWRVPMSWQARVPYVAGWLWNLTAGLRVVILPLIPITMLAFLPAEVQLRNAILLIPAVLTGTIIYPLWHNVRWTVYIWPLNIAVGWAQVLAIWDYSHGKVMSWEPSRSPKDASRRFRKAVCAWNGTLALAWVALAGWRIEQVTSVRFAIIALFGLVNLASVARVVFPGRAAA